jgi:predicted PurR-regulated permease PerM
MISSIITNVSSFIGDMLLILVYIFFFTYYQKKFEDAIIRLVPDNNKEETKTIISRSVRSAQQYLLGRLILIALLAVLYMIGFTSVGLEYAIFISLLAAIFSLIPYIGNIIGFSLAILASFVSGGDTTQIILIVVLFTVIQFIESYMLEPYIVGSKVDLNPVAVIVGVVLGGIVWGVVGMILAIPILAIIKVVFDNIEPLQPLGYMLDESGISSGDGWIPKIQNWLKKKVKVKK